jgi:protein phosphatase 1L
LCRDFSLRVCSHVAADLEEAQKVLAKGAFISVVQGVERVNGTLAITRSIGDYNLAQYLDQTPDVLVLSVDELQAMCGMPPDSTSQRCFIILGSDGLWESVTNDEAVHFVEDRLRQGFALQSIAHELGKQRP